MKPKGQRLLRSMEKGTLAMEVQAVSLQGREGQVGVGHPDQGHLGLLAATLCSTLL